MTRAITLALGLALALVFCASAQAQSVHFSRQPRISVDSGQFGAGHWHTETFPVPGLGFDYAHLAAVNPRSTEPRFVPLGRVAHVIPVFLPVYAPPTQVFIVQQPPSPPPVIVIQQAPAHQEVEHPRRMRPVEPNEEAALLRPAEQPREVGELVLIRRDGSVVLAVAFIVERGQLTYITREGVRRSLPLAELDIEATRRMNEERGTSLHLPA